MLFNNEVNLKEIFKQSKYFDSNESEFGNQFNYYFPEMFMQKGLLPRNIIRDDFKLKNALVLNLFPTNKFFTNIYFDTNIIPFVPDFIKKKYNLKDSTDQDNNQMGIQGSSFKDRIDLAIQHFKSMLEMKSQKKILSFKKIKKLAKIKKNKIKKAKKIIKSKNFKIELKDFKTLLKFIKKNKNLIKKSSLVHNKISNSKSKLKNLKHKIFPLILGKKPAQKIKQLSQSNQQFFQPDSLKDDSGNDSVMKKPKVDKFNNAENLSDYLKDNKLGLRARINDYDWALIGFSKLSYK